MNLHSPFLHLVREKGPEVHTFFRRPENPEPGRQKNRRKSPVKDGCCWVYAAGSRAANRKKKKNQRALPISRDRVEDSCERDVAHFAVHPVVAGIDARKHAPQGNYLVAVLGVAEHHVQFSGERKITGRVLLPPLVLHLKNSSARRFHLPAIATILHTLSPLLSCRRLVHAQSLGPCRD